MTRREKIATSLLKPINPSIVIVLGIYTIVWGLWILNPLFTVFTQAPLYSAMQAIAPEYVWGSIAVAAGLLVTRGATKPSYDNLRLGSFTGFLHWFVIGILYFMGDAASTGGITALTFAIYSAIVWVNIKVNRKHFK